MEQKTELASTRSCVCGFVCVALCVWEGGRGLFFMYTLATMPAEKLILALVAKAATLSFLRSPTIVTTGENRGKI